MTATVVALAVAVLTVVAYGVLADRFDYASVRRRQLDIWAAVMACACFGTIVYGGYEARQGARRGAPGPASATPTAVAPVPGGAPGVALPASGEVVLAPTATGVPVQMLVPALGPEVLALAPAAPDGRDEHDDRAPGSEASAPPWAVAPSATPALPVIVTPAVTTATVTPALRLATATRVIEPATATAVGGVRTLVPPPKVLPTATPLPPTAPPPTREPLPLPTSTPSCGDPAAAQVSLQNLAATPDRSGQELVIRFRAEVRNGSSFPVTLADISATAINRVAGAEQYGYGKLPDVAIEAGAVITLEGTVSLTKNPPPFGTTELCLAFALESCGQRGDRPVRQCIAVRGF